MTAHTVTSRSSAETPLRTALLDAAYDEVVSGSWARTRMADVARSAGVSRQTLYNEFGTKDALADALARRETEAFLTGVDALLSGRPTAAPGGDVDPIEAVREAVQWTLDRALSDPMLKAILTSVHDGGEGSMLLPLLTTRAEPVLAAASAHLLSFLSANWPAAPELELRQLAESLIRLIVSHVVLPTEPTDVTARVIAGFCAKVL